MTGARVLQQLLSEGYRVRALVRFPEKLDVQSELLELVQGDALELAAVQTTVEGCDAVISCLGIGGMGDGSKNTFLSESAKNIVAACPQGTSFSCISNTGVGNSIKAYPWHFRNVELRFFKNWKWFRAVLADKQRMERVLRKSHLKYTIVRSPQILKTDEQTGVELSADGRGIGNKVHVNDLAAFLVESALSHSGQRRIVSIASKNA